MHLSKTGGREKKEYEAEQEGDKLVKKEKKPQRETRSAWERGEKPRDVPQVGDEERENADRVSFPRGSTFNKIEEGGKANKSCARRKKRSATRQNQEGHLSWGCPSSGALTV